MSNTNAIASERVRLGLSQSELGEMVGKDRSQISRIESNPLSIDGQMLCKLSRIFKCSADYLLGLSEERVPKYV
jgi:transcriptional regulator with XRE-family HTH domain